MFKKANTTVKPHLKPTSIQVSGPFRMSRHPMYLGVILLFLGIPLMLGSVWTSVPVTLMTLLLMVRTILEERLLRQDLPGYQDYMRKTRYRLVPGIW